MQTPSQRCTGTGYDAKADACSPWARLVVSIARCNDWQQKASARCHYWWRCHCRQQETYARCHCGRCNSKSLHDATMGYTEDAHHATMCFYTMPLWAVQHRTMHDATVGDSKAKSARCHNGPHRRCTWCNEKHCTMPQWAVQQQVCTMPLWAMQSSNMHERSDAKANSNDATSDFCTMPLGGATAI